MPAFRSASDIGLVCSDLPVIGMMVGVAVPHGSVFSNPCCEHQLSNAQHQNLSPTKFWSIRCSRQALTAADTNAKPPVESSVVPELVVRFDHTYIRQGAVLLCVIEAVANYPFIAYRESQVVDFNVDFGLVFFLQ